ncbi:hypothetical protein AN643_03040 [Candidatus Epulonipiscioides saccharophilum]|nr:hypothetical protein AN643_03040 [Epulopiscium sp. SCG-B10WGA-EpuloB]
MSKKLRKSSIIAALVFSSLSFAPHLTLAADIDIRFTYNANTDHFQINGITENSIQALEISFSENISLNQNYYESFLDDGSLYILSKNKIFVVAPSSDAFLQPNFNIKLNSDVTLNGDIQEIKYFYPDSSYEVVKDPSYTVSGNANDYYQENVFTHTADESGNDSIGEIIIDIYDYHQSNKDIYHYLEDHYIEDTIDSINNLAEDENLDPKLKITLNTNYAIDSFDIAMDSNALNNLIDLPNASLEINTEVGSFEFDAVALEEMLDEASGDVHFKIIPTYGETSAQEKVIGNRTAYLVGIFESTSNNSMLDYPIEGEIIVDLAFQRGGMNADDIRAYCVFTNGDVKIMDSRYFDSSDEVRITLDEFGTYMIADEDDEKDFDIVEDQREEEEDKEEDKEEEDEDEDDNDWWDDNDDDDGGYRPGGSGGYTPPYVPPYVPPTVTPTPTPTPTPNIPTITLPPSTDPTLPTKDDAYYATIKHTFTDINSKDWFYRDVLDMYVAGYVHGMTATKFEPQGTTTRAQLATILYLIADTPNTFTANNYADVAYSDWFAKQVTWSAENDIFNEYVDKTFKPNANITREELVYAIYRFAKYEQIPILGISSVHAFVDGNQVSPWAIDSLQWAIANGILAGKDGNRLDPKGTATRAEICAILNRFLKSYDLKAIREARKALSEMGK